MAWELFNWGSRGLHYKTGVPGIYMSHIFIADAVRVVVQAEGPAGQQFQHVFHMKDPSGTPDYAFCLNCASTVENWIGNFYKNMVHGDVTFRQIVATGLNAVPAAQAVIGMSTLGARAGLSWPSQISCKLKFATNTSGRRHMGGVYGFPGVLTDLTAFDKFTGTYVASLQAVFGQLVHDASGNGCLLAIGSLTDAQAYPILRVVAVDDIMDSRRRRTANRGA